MRLPAPDALGWRVRVSPGVSLCVARLFCCAYGPPFLPLPPKPPPHTNGGGSHAQPLRHRPVCMSSLQAALPGDKVRSSDLCTDRISQDICHEQYRFGLCPGSWLSIARMFFVFYANEMVGLVGFRMGPVSEETKMCSEAETLGSILPSGERQGLEIELITVADDLFIRDLWKVIRQLGSGGSGSMLGGRRVRKDTEPVSRLLTLPYPTL